MRWLQRYLSEGPPTLQRFAEITASLAKLELRGTFREQGRRGTVYPSRRDSSASTCVTTMRLPRPVSSSLAGRWVHTTHSSSRSRQIAEPSKR